MKLLSKLLPIAAVMLVTRLQAEDGVITQETEANTQPSTETSDQPQGEPLVTNTPQPSDEIEEDEDEGQ